MEVIFGANPGEGALVTELTASQCMFQIVRTILENVPGTNVVTTSLEHPSAFDAARLYAERTGKEFRVAMANPATGNVDVQTILDLVDENTALLSGMSASNISGAILDMEAIVKGAREKKPDIYIVSDAVQHMPHSVLNVGELGTFPHPNYAAITAVVDYVCWIGTHFTDSTDRRTQYCAGMDRIHLQEHSLLIHMMEGTEEVPGLRHIPGVHVYVDSPDTVDRDLISAIGIDGIDYTSLVAEYYKRGITVFDRVNTSIYSKRIVESIGLTGAIRVSPLHCHNTDDIDEFLKVTAELAAIYAK